MYLAYINVQPWPIVLSANEELTILAHIYLNESISVGSEVKLDITKIVEGVEEGVPCLDTEWGLLGSCNYSGDAFTETFFHDFFCPNSGPDQPCSLPIEEGHYGQQYDDPYYVTLPNITLDMDWFLTGTFNIRLKVLDSSGAEFTCLEFVVELEQREEPSTSTVSSPPAETCDICLNYTSVILNRTLIDQQ